MLLCVCGFLESRLCKCRTSRKGLNEFYPIFYIFSSNCDKTHCLRCPQSVFSECVSVSFVKISTVFAILYLEG
jgi:hypothetical protein